MSLRSRSAPPSNIAVFELPHSIDDTATRLVSINRLNEDLASDRVSRASIQNAVDCRLVVKLLLIELQMATLLVRLVKQKE